MNNPFVKKDYATLPKLTKLITKELEKHEFDVRKDGAGCFVVSTDRADVLSLHFKMFKRSFDFWATDAFGNVVIPTKSCFGQNWRGFMQTQVRDVMYLMRTSWVEDGTIINNQWQKMVREINDAPSDGQMFISPNMATALYMGIIDERFA